MSIIRGEPNFDLCQNQLTEVLLEWYLTDVVKAVIQERDKNRTYPSQDTTIVLHNRCQFVELHPSIAQPQVPRAARYTHITPLSPSRTHQSGSSTEKLKTWFDSAAESEYRSLPVIVPNRHRPTPFFTHHYIGCFAFHNTIIAKTNHSTNRDDGPKFRVQPAVR